jgi:imidazole glycerol-phosphate synthase subunit HisH
MSLLKNNKVAIIDYNLGNLFSVLQVCSHLGMDAFITSNGADLQTADYVILPGVGSFPEAMKNLEALNLVEPIKNYIATGKPFMGVCLGLQLLFTESTEFGSIKGLNIIEGTVERFLNTDAQGNKYTVPQIEWNTISKGAVNWQQSPLSDCSDNEFMYFVHSYYVKPTNNNVILTYTNYAGITYCSSIQQNNVFATQFHPEKSAEKGITIYKNWFNNK